MVVVASGSAGHLFSMKMLRFLFVVVVVGFAACDARAGDQQAAVADTSAAAGPVAAQEVAGLPRLEGLATFRPVDEGGTDASFARFRTALLQAVERRDSAGLVDVVAPEIKLSFGGDAGIASFHEWWRPGDGDSEIWGTMATVLRNGGTFARPEQGDTLFMAPYVYAAWPDLDPFEHVATLTESAVVRAGPADSARAIGVLPHQVVRYRHDEPEAPEGWTPIELPDGTQGWMRSADVYSPVGYRAIFAKQSGRWRMIALIAGD